MISENALLGFEENGGFMFGKHNHVRDGGMALALFLELLVSSNKSMSEELATLPPSFTTKDKISCEKEDADKIISKLLDEFPNADTTDGVKIVFDKRNWVMVRPSGTEPIIRIYVESDSEKNLEVIEQNIDEGLSNFLDKSFDTVLVSQTIQVLKNPKQALEEITRIGHQSIIVIPNFGHWKSRLTLFLEGKMPVTESLPEKWYETPNIHLCTLTDFENLCAELNIVIEEKKILDSTGRVRAVFSTWSNLLGSSVIYRLSR